MTGGEAPSFPLLRKGGGRGGRSIMIFFDSVPCRRGLRPEPALSLTGGQNIFELRSIIFWLSTIFFATKNLFLWYNIGNSVVGCLSN